MFDEKKAFKKRLKKLIIGLSILIIVLFSYYIIRLNTSFSIPCIFHLISGKNCQFCGMTRMFSAMLQFNFAEAMIYNYFLFFTLPLLLFIFIIAIRDYLLNLPPKKWFLILCSIYIACSIVWAIIRNIYGI